MKAYCLICGEEAKEGEISCWKCKGVNLILGENGKDYIRTKKGIKCICGEENFSMVTHISMGEVHKKVYRCKSCKKTITIDTKVDPMY